MHLERGGSCSRVCKAFKANQKLAVGERRLTYEALVVFTEACEELVGGVKEGLTDQLKPLPARTSPVQSYGTTFVSR